MPDLSQPRAELRPAIEADVPIILALIRALADYERLGHEAIATEEDLRRSLFGQHPAADVVIAWSGAEAVGFAIYFQTFSTFLGKPGIYRRICLSFRSGVGAGLAGPCWPGSRAPRSTGTPAAWSGRS